MPTPTLDELSALLQTWTERAQVARQKSRMDRAGDAQTAYYHKGISDTYQQAIRDLEGLFGEIAVTVPNAASPVTYVAVSESTVNDLLTSAGLYIRELTVHADHVVTAVFSRLQPTTQEQRLQALTQADSRIVILSQGKLMETGEPFIDFAFVR